MRTWASFFCSIFLAFSLALSPAADAAPQKSKATATKTVKKKSAKAVKTKKVSAKKNVRKKAVVAASNKSVRKTAGKTTTSRKFAASKKVSKKRYAVRKVRGPSYAQLHGLRGSSDPLGLQTTAVLAYDMDSNEVLYEKNADERLPIASITKLMTALVIVESGVSLDQKFKVTKEDFVRSSARSKLRNGMYLSRKQALHLALMSSDNRAAHFLARTFPGGKARFIRDMNTKAAMIGMFDSVFYDSIGLNNENKSSALDLSRLLASAGEYDLIRELSTTPMAQIPVGRRLVTSRTTNSFVANDNWDVSLQKTGLTTAAGYCLAMETEIGGKTVAIIFLDSPNKAARNQDAEKLKAWLSGQFMTASASEASN